MIRIDKETKTISMNRGDRATIKLKVKDGKTFTVDDKIKFSIVDKGDYDIVKFQRVYTVLEESDTFFLTLIPDDTRFDEIVSTKKEYWYEIEYNGEYTVIGYDDDKAKKFILFPEAPSKNEEGE